MVNPINFKKMESVYVVDQRKEKIRFNMFDLENDYALLGTMPICSLLTSSLQFYKVDSSFWTLSCNSGFSLSR